MKKSLLLLGSVSTVCMLIVGLSSCKDDEPFVKPNLSVASATLSVAENAGTLQVGVTLDKGAPEDITIEYDLGGTAASPADYSVTGKEGEIQIAKGETSGTATIQIVSDAVYEGNETIELSLDDVSSEDVLITNNDEVIITITDDDPQMKVSFPVTTLTVVESDNEELLEIDVALDNPAPQNVTVEYTIAHVQGQGHAIDDLYAEAEEIPSQYVDYIVEGGAQSVVIAQGSTTAKIQLQLLSDFIFEDDETIELTISTVSGGIQIGTNNKMTITLQQENGKIVALVWQEDYTDVDMDLFLWLGDDASTLEIVAASTNPEPDPKLELLFIPAVIQNAAGALSYTYYAGTEDPMNFEAQIIDFVDGAVEAQANYDIYPGTYTLANLNKWNETEIDPIKAQTFTLVAGAITGITDPIVTPAANSRIPTKTLSKGIKKMKSGTNRVTF
jgi:hypothetical protein